MVVVSAGRVLGIVVVTVTTPDVLMMVVVVVSTYVGSPSTVTVTYSAGAVYGSARLS